MKSKSMLAGALGAAVLFSGTAALAGGVFTDGDMPFTPLNESALVTDTPDTDGPWTLPAGYTQTLVGGEDETTCRGLDIYGDGLDDWQDMNTVNETGRRAGRYLYRTHEVRLRSGSIPDATYPEGGAVSVIDLETCRARVIAQDPMWNALDGIVWTPWGTILFAEETTGGRLFELTPGRNPMKAESVVQHDAVGRMAHEGIEVSPNGDVFVVDEWRGQSAGEGGGIYKFVPDTYGDLSSGDLYMLAVGSDTVTGEGVGQGRWVGPIDPNDVRADGLAQGGTSYQRPEDLELIDGVLFAAITEGTRDANGDQNYDGRVIAIDLDSLMVTNYVFPGDNVAVEIGRPGDAGHQTGFDNPDNLAVDHDGNLWIVEDNVPSDIWVVKGDTNGVADNVGLFASLTDVAAEGTGIYFGKEDDILYVNVQHSVYDDGDGTWAITKGDDKDDEDGHEDDDDDRGSGRGR